LLPPLKVFPDEELAEKYQSFSPLNEISTEDCERFSGKLGMSVDEMLKGEDFPKFELAYKYAPGESLVRPEQVEHLATQCEDCMAGIWKS
jgi:hypothetical protein